MANTTTSHGDVRELMISDIVALGELPASVRDSLPAYVGCIAGVSLKQEYVRTLHEIGFEHVEIVQEKGAAELLGVSDPGAVVSTCACADPVVGTLVGDLVKSVPIEDLLAAANLVVSVQMAARKGGD